MRMRLLIFAICLASSCIGFTQDPVKLRLTTLFNEAEQCYLMDDYQQLQEYCNQYGEIFDEYGGMLTDSVDVFQGYYYKMLGAYHYGLADGNGFSFSFFDSERYYLNGLEIFKQRNDQDKVVALHKELAQLYYKTKLYNMASVHLDTVLTQYDIWLNDLGIMSVEGDYYETLSQLAMCNARIASHTEEDTAARELFALSLSQIGQARRYYESHKSDRNYGETLRKQGKILMMQGDRMGSTNTGEARLCYQEYVKSQCTLVGQRLAAMDKSQRGQYWLATHQFLYDCYRLGGEAPEMLYDLALFSKGYLLAFERKNKETETRWQ